MNLKSAALLHTEVAVRTGRQEVFHLKAAREYLDRIEDVSLRREMKRSWFLAVAHHLHRSPSSWGSFPLMKDSLKSFPRDPEIYLAVASVFQTAGRMGVEGMLERAEDLYRGVLQRDPAHVEAHWRLGGVLQLTGCREEAIRELRWSLEHTDDRQIEFVALVLLGEIYDQLGDLSKAAESFRAALEIDPHCQAAAIALSHALHRLGDGTGSRDVVNEFLHRDGTGPDRWWLHVRGSSERLDSILSGMREQVLQ